jgi:AcrR family transcriptional regulator
MLTDRGQRTRAALIEAARRVFSESGFVDGSVLAIAQAAGVSNATFYTYFRSKEEIFLDVAAELVQDLEFATDDMIDPRSLSVSITKANAYVIDTYAAHGKMLRVVAEAADHNVAIREAWRDIRRSTVAAAARNYANLQAGGHLDSSLSPNLLATVLGGATEHAAYVATFLDPEVDRGELERALHHVWLNALTPPRPAKRTANR